MERPVPLRWLIMLVFVLSSALNYLDRLTLTSLAPLLKTEFSLSNESFGYILTAFNLTYAATAPFAGLLIDRVGLNKGISLAVSLWSLANMATGLVNSLVGFVLCRGWLGIAESGGVPATGKAISKYLPPRERALGNAVSQVGISIGGMLAPLIAIPLALRYGWRWAFVLTGAIGLVWIPLWLWVARKGRPAEQPSTVSTHATGLALLKDVRLRRIIAATALGMTPYALWFNWITIFLTDVTHLSLAAVAVPAAIPPLWANAGGLAGGWLSLHWVRRGASPVQARKQACLWSAVLLLFTALAPISGSAWAATAVISFSLFWAAAFSVNVYTLPLDVFGGRGAAFAVSTLTCAYGVMQAVFSPLIGMVADRWGFLPVCAVVAVLPLGGSFLLRGVTESGGARSASSPEASR